MKTFGDDLSFLSRHADVVVLEAKDSDARVAAVPAMQGRVMTSSLDGEDGLSFGWINHELITVHERQAHINTIGGEDRFWLGPEGGQFGLFFKKGDPFNYEHWQAPGPVDWGWWVLSKRKADQAHFYKQFNLTNYSNTNFELSADRIIRLHTKAEISDIFKIAVPKATKIVSFESHNTITNQGDDKWHMGSGLLSIWILGKFNSSASTTVVLPFHPGPEAKLGQIVNDKYFGKIGEDRLKIEEKGVVFFKGDAKYRCKIGLSALRAKNTIGSYDPENKVLTLVNFTLPPEAKMYVNNLWEIQEEPFAGDVVNTYNDGPYQQDGKQIGPFNELESSSPAAALAPGDSMTHVHRTAHFQGPEEELSKITEQTLGLPLSAITSQFNE
ncbi:MAG: hypothetical protein H6696_01975 [Deferribacteres bacterium]|nr:hypothetical protein [candidate division KSB1 bacterium]MCB9500680.1 hypothetical protein [Deferribacteres bacterium]